LAGRIKKELRFTQDDSILGWPMSAGFLDRQEDISEGSGGVSPCWCGCTSCCHSKYNLSLPEAPEQLHQAIQSGFPGAEASARRAGNCDPFQCLEALLDQLEQLQAGSSSARKNIRAQGEIYYKRHIAVDIPSVYGRYRSASSTP
jgi:pyruvate, orthophosphate dikinase